MFYGSAPHLALRFLALLLISSLIRVIASCSVVISGVLEKF